jgi:uncharacterized protein with HEPN domain
MRDKLIHEYFSVDLPRVWDVVESELPDLLTRVDELLGGNTEREPEAL